VVRFEDHATQAALSLYMYVGAFISSSVKCSPSTMEWSWRRHFVHSSVAYISASAELLAVIVCRFDIQWRGPLKYIKNPERDLLVKSSVVRVSFLRGFDWSCGPQFASQSPVMGLSSGNFTYDSTLCCSLLLKLIPKDLVPFRYRIVRLTWSRCLSVHFSVYFAKMLVTVAISGRVEIDSHVKQPMYTCIVCMSSSCSCFDLGMYGMVSIGWPDLYGVLTVFTAGDARPEI
jgi:hypothetical protein